MRSCFGTISLSVLGFLITACGVGGSYTKTLSNSSLGSNSSGFTPGPSTALSRQVKTIIDTNCIGCHSNFTDVATLIDLQVLVPGNPGASKMNIRVQASQMPPTGALDAASKQAIFDWIAAGPANFKVAPLFDPATDLFYVPR